MMTNTKFFTIQRSVFAAAGVFVAMQGLPVYAQLPADANRAATGPANAGRVQEQFEDGDLVPQVSPRVEVKDLILQQAPEGAGDIRLVLNSLEMEGVTAYTPAQLQGVYADKLGQNISLADVYSIATALTNKYRNDGYILTQVIVPPQTIEGGVVKLQVVEGYVDNIAVAGNDAESAKILIRAYASHIQTGKALNVRDLERYLLLINDLPGVEARSILSPSQTQTGAADLRIIIERDPYDALLAIDNYGSRYLGPTQLSAAGAANSYFGNNERITGQIVLTPDPTTEPELAFIALGYEHPVWDNGTKVQLNFSNTNTEPGFDLKEFDVHGRSMLYSVKLTHPFIRARSQNLYGHVLFDWRNVDSSNNLEPTRRDRIRALRAGGSYEFLDTLLGVGVNSADIQFSKGLDILGSSDEDDARLTRPFADPEFFKMTAALQRLQRVSSNVNLLVSAEGQWSADALLSSEEFGVGGVNFGRGYSPSEIVGDDGVSGKIELQLNKPYPWSFVEDYQLFGFYDVGVVWNKDATASAQKRDSLASAGLGIRTEFEADTKADLALAVPLTRDVETKDSQGAQVYFSLSKGF